MTVLVVNVVLCALAPTVETLIAYRVLQGIGGGLVLANVMAEITSVFPKQERRKARRAFLAAQRSRLLRWRASIVCRGPLRFAMDKISS